MSLNILDGKKVATEIYDNLKEEIELNNIIPGLGIILVGERKDSHSYVNMKKKRCNYVGIKNKDIYLPEETSEFTIINEIKKLNNDSSIHGILVQLPLPEHINIQNVLNHIDPQKDIEGFHPQNMGNLFCNNYKEHLIPCTPKGCLNLLDYYNIELKGKNVVVVGKSNVVGLPLSLLLLQREATVSTCHIWTKNLKEYTQNADIILVACGKPNLITKDYVKDGVVVIDIGINHIKDETFNKPFKIVGDVDFESVKEKASYITPVPGGVGPMTIAMLMENTYLSAKYFEENKKFENCRLKINY